MKTPRIQVRMQHPNSIYDSVLWKTEDGEIVEEVVGRDQPPSFDEDRGSVAVCDHRGAGGEQGFHALINAFSDLEVNHRLAYEED